jgi:hypothetical protein
MCFVGESGGKRGDKQYTKNIKSYIRREEINWKTQAETDYRILKNRKES